MYNFLRWINKFPVRVSKHQASKKNYQHKKNPSRGERNHQKFISK